MACFEAHYEQSFKEFIQCPHKRLSTIFETDSDSESASKIKDGGLYVVKSGGLARLGRFASHECFLVIFLEVDPVCGIKSVLNANSKPSLKELEQAVLQSDLQLTLGYKRTITSVGSLMKSYNLPEAANQLKRGRQEKGRRGTSPLSKSNEKQVDTLLADIVDIMGCEGFKSRALLDTNCNSV